VVRDSETDIIYSDVLEVLAKGPLLLYKFLREKDHTQLFDFVSFRIGWIDHHSTIFDDEVGVYLKNAVSQHWDLHIEKNPRKHAYLRNSLDLLLISFL
jgi:hypothetical protein